MEIYFRGNFDVVKSGVQYSPELTLLTDTI